MLTSDAKKTARGTRHPEGTTGHKSITPFTVRQLHAITGHAVVGGDVDGDGDPEDAGGRVLPGLLCYKNKPVFTVQLCVKLVARETEFPLSDLVLVEDGTGTVACFFYRNHEAAPPRPDFSTMVHNRYYMVFGTVRALTAVRGFPGTNIHVDVVCCREMTDANELTNHFLRCIYEEALQARGGARGASTGTGTGTDTGVSIDSFF